MTASSTGSVRPVGVDLDREYTDVDTDIPFQLGTRYEAANGNKYRFVKAAAAKTATYLYIIDEDYIVQDAATTALTNSLPNLLGIPVATSTAPASLDASATYTYFWIQTAGSMEAYAKAASAADALVYTTTTGGQMDDGDGSGNIVANAKWVDTVGAGAAGTIFAFDELNYVGT